MAERSSLVRLQREFDVEVDWVGYELHPETPAGGAPLASWLADAAAYVRSFAAGFGIHDIAPPPTLANTRRALAVSQHAREMGRLDPFRAATFDAYWREGRGIESDEDLAAIAEATGLEPGAAVAAASDPSALARVDEARRAALAAGVTGIPTFEVGAVRVVGCRPYDVLADAVRRGGARRRGG